MAFGVYIFKSLCVGKRVAAHRSGKCTNWRPIFGMWHAKFSSHLLNIFSRRIQKCECVIAVFCHLCVHVGLLVRQASAVHINAFDACT